MGQKIPKPLGIIPLPLGKGARGMGIDSLSSEPCDGTDIKVYFYVSTARSLLRNHVLLHQLVDEAVALEGLEDIVDRLGGVVIVQR